MKSNLVEVCKLGKTIGLKGFLKLHDFSDFPSQFKKGAKFYDMNSREFTIDNYDKTRSLVRFAGFLDIDTASALTNLTLYRTLDDTRKYCKLQKDEYFYFDIISCLVIENELVLGEIIDILEIGSGFLFAIKTANDLVNSGLTKEFFIPYNDNFIKKVDLEARRIHVMNSLEILRNS